MFLEFIVHLQFVETAEQIGFESHWTSLHAFTATDTVLFFGSFALLGIQEEESAEAFISRHVFCMIHGATHHRATTNDLTGVSRYTTCEGDDFVDRRTKTHGVVTGFGNVLSGDSDDAADERFILLHGFVDSEDRSYIVNDSSYFDRQSSARYLATDASVDELFLTALRIAQFERQNLNT